MFSLILQLLLGVWKWDKLGFKLVTCEICHFCHFVTNCDSLYINKTSKLLKLWYFWFILWISTGLDKGNLAVWLNSNVTHGGPTKISSHLEGLKGISNQKYLVLGHFLVKKNQTLIINWLFSSFGLFGSFYKFWPYILSFGSNYQFLTIFFWFMGLDQFLSVLTQIYRLDMVWWWQLLCLVFWLIYLFVHCASMQEGHPEVTELPRMFPEIPRGS